MAMKSNSGSVLRYGRKPGTTWSFEGGSRKLLLLYTEKKPKKLAFKF